MSATPDFLDTNRPDVPDIVVTRGITPFHLPSRPVRGRLVRLGPLAARAAGPPPEPAARDPRWPGEALALAAAPGVSALKYRGSASSLQAKGDGPVPMLLADCTQERRSCAATPATTPTSWTRCSPPRSLRRARRQLLGTGYLSRSPWTRGRDMERLPGHRHHRGRHAGRDGAALLPHQRADRHADVHLARRARTPAGWRAAALVLERVAGRGRHRPRAGDQAAHGRGRGAPPTTLMPPR